MTRFAVNPKLSSMLILILILFDFAAITHAVDSKVVRIFAAASTTNAVADICTLFSDNYPVKAVPSFASSSTLAKQIENGAPADIYLSANKKWMDYLEAKKMILPDSRFNLLSNMIVFIVPRESNVGVFTISADLNLRGLLGDGWLAMGDPDHVPAGMYAESALRKLGLYAAVENRIARAKDVRAALTLVERGESPLGIVYATDAAISRRVKVIGTFPSTSHPPIVYPVAVISGHESETVKNFINFLKTPASAAVCEKYGFSVW